MIGTGRMLKQKNRKQILFAALRMTIAGASVSPLDAAETGATSRPNILVILVDQQHAGMLGCAGNRYVKTPAMDSLAATGARFDLAYCADPVCVPSRFSMLTGRMPGVVGLESNDDMGNARKRVTSAMLENAMGNVFRRAGYETVYGGKQHVPMTIEEAGFRDIEKDQGPKLAETCADYLRGTHDKPFLLVASFINPHDICFMALSAARDPGKIRGPKPMEDAMALPAGISREEFFARLCPPLPDNYEIPPGEPDAILAADRRGFRTFVRNEWSDEQWRIHRWTYARLTEVVDSQIDQVLKALREAGLDRNTLVVFASDHGDMDASHRLEHKSVLYDEASRVPFIVSWPGVTRPGLVDKKHLVSTGLDLIPTLCDFAGIPQPASLKGRSVRALAEGRPVKAWRETLVTENGSSRMLRSARYKYVVYATGARREMLTDMVEDPGEMKNLALDPAFAGVLSEHRRMLVAWYAQKGMTPDSRYFMLQN